MPCWLCFLDVSLQWPVSNQEYVDPKVLNNTWRNSFETLHDPCICFSIHTYTMYMGQQTPSTLKQEVRTSALNGSAPQPISLTSLMTESWAPPPSFAAISAGLVGSVTWMFLCNDRFQIRYQEHWTKHKGPLLFRINIYMISNKSPWTCVVLY